jgi:hypothetical protein
MFSPQMILTVIIIANLAGLLISAFFSFLLTFWRTRLTWFDWTTAFLLNLPIASFLMTLSSKESPLITESWSSFSNAMLFGGAGFDAGIFVGLLSSRWAISVRSDSASPN